MDFFEHQDTARRKTGLLVFYFVLAVILMIAAVYAAAVFVFSLESHQAVSGKLPWWNPELLFTVTVVILVVIILGSLYKIFELASGGEAVAIMLGGKKIPPNTTDLAERRLLNVVEEMALAAGMAVPTVFVLDGEEGINAFAAGYTPDHAVIGVNRGTIDYLSRDELQGVIAHELSHIMNGDMRLNIRLIGLLHGILLVALIGYYMLRASGGRSNRREKGGGAWLLLMGLAAMVVGYIGLVFGRLIKAAVSRQREYLADAAAVQFTRDPQGLAGALKKIGGLSFGSQMRAPAAEEASHMFFGTALRQLYFGPFATHPPLTERIQRLDPAFDGTFPPVQRIAEPAPEQTARVDTQPKPRREGWQRPLETFGTGKQLPLDPLLVLATIGAPEPGHVNYAASLIDAMPQNLVDAMRDVSSARAVVCALLLSEDATLRARQMQDIEALAGKPLADETARLAPAIHEQGPRARLPIVEMVQNTLRNLSPPQYQSLRKLVVRLIQSDRQITLFEFVLDRLLLVRLNRHFHPTPPPAIRYHSVRAVGDEIAVLLSALAHAGQDDAEAARQAFATAVQTLGALDDIPTLRSRDACNLRALSQALDTLVNASPPIKKRLLQSAMICVVTDGKVSVEEAELLRTISESLDCPMPPLLASANR